MVRDTGMAKPSTYVAPGADTMRVLVCAERRASTGMTGSCGWPL